MFEAYTELALSMGADHAVPFLTEQIAFDDRTILKCMFGCTDWSYGHTCPSRPGSLMPWEYRRLLSQYRGGIIIHSTDKHLSQNISFEVERRAFADGFYMAFSLSDCAHCEKCAGFAGKPCVDPKKARPAFHSVGIDVFKTVRAFGLPLETLKEPGETVNWYSAVFIE